MVNQLMGIPLIRAGRRRTARTFIEGQTPDKYLVQFSQLCQALLTVETRGRVVMEIGPGDVLPLGFLFLGCGARRYVAVDPFMGCLDGPRATRLYADLLAAAPSEIRRTLEALGVEPSSFPFAYDHLVEIQRQPLENLEPLAGPVDIVVSYAALGGLYDVPAALAKLRLVLAPGAVMVHFVDYGPYGRWRSLANPLAFLTVPDRLWRLMGSRRGMPNRLRHSQLVAAFRAQGYDCETLATTMFSEEVVRDMRALLPNAFKDLEEDDLRVATSLLRVTSSV